MLDYSRPHRVYMVYERAFIIKAMVKVQKSLVYSFLSALRYNRIATFSEEKVKMYGLSKITLSVQKKWTQLMPRPVLK